MRRRQFLSLFGGAAAALPVVVLPTPAAAGPPRGRDPKTAIAHTREEGGRFWRGGAEYGEFHSAVYEDGWIYDTRLDELGTNEGWRRLRFPGTLEEIKLIWHDPAENPGGYDLERAQEEFRHSDWLRRRAMKRLIRSAVG